MELTKESVISPENYNELKSMLISNDSGSVNLGLVILQESNYEKSKVYILCLLKECYSEIYKHSSKIEEEYSELFDTIKNDLLKKKTDIIQVSFETIFNIAKERKNEDELNFILTIFANELKEILREFSFEFLDYLDLHLVMKGTPIKILYNDNQITKNK